ncbi:MAG: hypothetical protein ABJA02_03855 [Acidobacteriota bacterium]
MASIKSATCFGHSGQPLSEYPSRREAQDAAEYANTAYRKKLVPYECERCGAWHLSPAERQTPSTIGCKCLDRYGMPKALYDTKDGAKQRAKIASKEKGVGLSVYQCPHTQGFHLTGKK